MSALLLGAALGPIPTLRGAPAIADVPFLQPVSIKFASSPELRGAQFRKIAITRDGVVYVLTDKGLARLFGNTLALDKSFRPLAGQVPRDIAPGPAGEIYQLFRDHWLSNGDTGKPWGKIVSAGGDLLAPGQIAVAAGGEVRVVGGPHLGVFETTLFQDGTPAHKTAAAAQPGRLRLYSFRDEFFALSGDTVIRFTGATNTRIKLESPGAAVTCLAFRGEEMLVGTTNGYFGLSLKTGVRTTPLHTRLPCPDITCLVPAAEGLWAGTRRGVFFVREPGTARTAPTEPSAARAAPVSRTVGPAALPLPDGPGGFRYFASKRWLNDDEVIDLALDRDGHALVLTKAGLNTIEFRPMTLADKAAHYDRKIRQRHIRFGLCSELRLLQPGDITSAEMIDTDNDGTWSNYYLASQAFRFAVTGSEEARRNAWETFAAFERMLAITGTNGFIARTFERRGFKLSDPDRWRDAADPAWEWKGHTSSDEITAHALGSSILWECVAKTPAEKKRVAEFFDRILGHIVRNNWYLIDADGKPTLWGRWHPEYVNWFPPTIGDRRLNSAEIIGMLQFGHRITGRELYRQKAFELIERHGYLDNIVSPMSRVAVTPGFIHLGNDMGNEWNHSDDLLAFDTYWFLPRFAFNENLRKHFASAVRDHWLIEKAERNPLWNFTYAATGARDADLEGAAWVLRTFPLDLITWRVENSHRRDLTKLPPNFRQQELAELLPADERPITRWNTQPFILDGGDAGHIEFAGDEFLLPYWMGRYLKLIR